MMNFSKINFRSFFPEKTESYSFIRFRADIIAALTVAIVAIPQSMAYAVIAGVHPKFGLYSCIVPVIVAAIFGSSKYLISGPTNAISMVVSSTFASVAVSGMVAENFSETEKIGMLFFLSFIVGIIQLAMGLLKFGSLANFVSHSVVIGFTAGAGILISFNQLKNFLGLDVPSHHEFIDTLEEVFRHIGETNIYALSIGIFTILFMVLTQKISKKIPSALLSIIISATLVAIFGLDKFGVKLIGTIPRSLPPLSSFPVSLELIRAFFPSALAIATLGIVEAFSIAKSISNSSGEKISSNREFIGQGLSNMAAGFFSSIPGSGSFTRSAVNFASGAKTRLSGIFSGILVAVILLIFAPFAKYIPIASLAGMLIVIAYSMVDKKSLVLSYKSSHSDRAVLMATFLSTLFLELEAAVYIGVILSLVLFLRKVSHPQVNKVRPGKPGEKLVLDTDGKSEISCDQISIFQIDGPLFFGAINELEERLYTLENGKEKVIIIRMKGVRIIDASGIHALEKFLSYCHRRRIKLILTNVRPEVYAVFEKSGALDLIKEENIAEDTTAAIRFSFKKYIDKKICRKCQDKLFKECR